MANHRKLSKQSLAEEKYTFKQAKKVYKIEKKEFNNLLKRNDLVDFTKFDSRYSNLESAKKNLIQAKHRFKLAKSRHGKLYPGFLKKSRRFILRTGYSAAVSKLGSTVLNQDEDLARYGKAKSTYGQSRFILTNSTKLTTKTAKGVSKVSYSVANRSYNLMRGGGFTRTPHHLRLSTRLKSRVLGNRRVQQVSRAFSRVFKNPFAKGTTRVFGALTKNILSNPLALKGLASIFILIVIVSSIMSFFAPVAMKERELTEAWLHFTKLDREKSTDKVVYYSPIDEYVNYTDFRYDKTFNTLGNTVNLSLNAIKRKGMPNTDVGKDWLDGMWKELNDDSNNLKTVNQLVKSDNSNYNLDEKEYKNFVELNKMDADAGMSFPALEEVDNFLYLKNDAENRKKPLLITERFGYKDKENIHDRTTFQVTIGQNVYAPFSGTVTEVTDNSVTIEYQRKRITFFNLTGINLTKDSQISKSTLIGQASQDTLDVKYEKYLKRNIGNLEYIGDVAQDVGEGIVDAGNAAVDITKDAASNIADGVIDLFEEEKPKTEEEIRQELEEKRKAEEAEKAKKEAEEAEEKRKEEESALEWTSVNVGFYVANVQYTQETYVIQDFKLDKDKSSRIRRFVKLVKEYEPNATNEGIAAMLGNFEVESGVQPKRAEGDYLSPPVGASETSWDDPAWLDIGGYEIYDGRYPNILRRGLGLGQWTDTRDGAVRHTLLRQFADANNKKWYDLELQVNFMFNGDSPHYVKLLKEIVTSTGSVEDLTYRFLTEWEGINNGTLPARTASAKEMLGFLNKKINIGQPLADMNEVIITSPYGWRTIFGTTEFHHGIDLQYAGGSGNPRNTSGEEPIYSIESGVVVDAGDFGSGGNAVVVKHAEDFYTIYAHLNHIYVSKGDEVNAGDAVGTLGNTGRSSGPHLHFQVNREYRDWSSGTEDPESYLIFE